MHKTSIQAMPKSQTCAILDVIFGQVATDKKRAATKRKLNTFANDSQKVGTRSVPHDFAMLKVRSMKCGMAHL